MSKGDDDRKRLRQGVRRGSLGQAVMLLVAAIAIKRAEQTAGHAPAKKTKGS